MNSIVLTFSGPIGSGKSTLAWLVSTRLRWSHASFGSYVRKVAKKNGLDNSRKALQLTGELLISRGWGVFCKEVITEANWKPGSNLIVEGIRHIEAIETLRELVIPAKLYIIYISLDDTKREKRLKLRDKNESINMKKLEMHSTEVQIKTKLFNQADLIVDNNRAKEEVASEIISWIHSLQI